MAETHEGEHAALLARARQQLASATEDFQHGLTKVRSRDERRRLAAAYIDLMQNYLGKTQVRLDRYRGRLQVEEAAESAVAPPEEPAPAPAPPGIADAPDGSLKP